MIALLLLLMAGEPAHTITAPSWAQRPTEGDLLAVFPQPALTSGVEGHVTIKCAVSKAGDLGDCTVVVEKPGGWGFGDAALKLSAMMKMHPQLRDGVPVGGAYIAIPISFLLENYEGGDWPLDHANRCTGLLSRGAFERPGAEHAHDIWAQRYQRAAAKAGLGFTDFDEKMRLEYQVAHRMLATPEGVEEAEACRREAVPPEPAPATPPAPGLTPPKP